MKLSHSSQDSFLSVAVERRHDEQSEFIMEEDENAIVYLMLEGFAIVISTASDGKTVIYDQVGPGDLVGVPAAIDGLPRSASVLTCGPCKTACVTAVRFRELLENDPKFSLEIHSLLAKKIRQLTTRVFEFSTQLLRERLVRELLRIMSESSQQEETLRIEPAPTHFELAARISTHREAVSREMSRLSRLGVIKREGRSLVAHSREALINLAVNS